VLLNRGTGGLDEVKQQLEDDKIQFAVLEVTVSGDEYSPVKHVFLTWIGKNVPAGIAKARSAGHRAELLSFVQEVVSISAEYQTDQHSEVSYDPIAQALTKMRPAYHTSKEVTNTRQAMSASKATGIKTSKLLVVDEANVIQALKSVFKGEKDWVILAYVVGKKDEVELVKSGKGGLSSLRQEFPTDRIYFCVLRMMVNATGREDIPKFIIVTMVGDNVKPLQKARSAGQRQDVCDFVLAHCPYHTHYQPGSAKELTEDAILSLFS